MTKEKIIEYIEDLEREANKADKYFAERNEQIIKNQKLQQEKENLIKYLETPIDTKLFDKSIDYVNGYIEANSIILNMLKGGKYE